MNLYEINYEIETLLNTVDENGEMTDETVEALGQLAMFENEKIDNIGCFVKSLLSEAQAIKEEKDKLNQRQKSKENQADRLKAFLNNYMVQNGKTKFETPRCVISFRKSTAVNITNEDLIPREYKEAQPDKILKAEIKDALKAGVVVAGAELLENQNLQIK